jgi:hypothetical protein
MNNHTTSSGKISHKSAASSKDILNPGNLNSHKPLIHPMSLLQATSLHHLRRQA